jgi:Mor family transcriptional regulator
LEKNYGELPLNTVASTGGGGRHYYFDYPESLSIKSRSMAIGKEFPGIDVKADGGYIFLRVHMLHLGLF